MHNDLKEKIFIKIFLKIYIKKYFLYEKFLNFLLTIYTYLKIYSLKTPFLHELFVEKHIRLLKKLSEKSDDKKFRKIFIDIGAGTGFYSFYFAKNGYFVVSIEPERKNFDFILKMSKILQLKDSILPVNCLISNTNGKKNIYINNLNFSGLSTTFFIKHWKKMPTKSYKLDKILKILKIDINKIKIINIDVERSEYFVILGMKKLFKKISPIITFECFIEDNYKKIKKILEKNNYRIYHVAGSNFLSIKK